jgi:hypothetical protein
MCLFLGGGGGVSEKVKAHKTPPDSNIIKGIKI